MKSFSRLATTQNDSWDNWFRVNAHQGSRCISFVGNRFHVGWVDKAVRPPTLLHLTRVRFFIVTHVFFISWNWTRTWFDFNFLFLSLFLCSAEINLESVLINHLCEVEMCIKWFLWTSNQANVEAKENNLSAWTCLGFGNIEIFRCIRGEASALTLKKLLQRLQFLWLFHNILTSNTTRRERKARNVEEE